MAVKKPDNRPPIVRLEGLTDQDQRPEVQIEVYDEKGECIHAAPVKEDGSYSIPDGVRKRAQRYVLGPAGDVPEGQEVGYALRASAFARLEESGRIAIGRPIWSAWIPFLRCATGSVRRCWPGRWWYTELAELATAPVRTLERTGTGLRLASRQVMQRRLSARSGGLTAIADRITSSEARVSPVASLDELLAWRFRCAPVCDATVEVYRRTCCWEPWIVHDPRLPELVDWLEDLIPDPELPEPPFPGPDPDPFPGPGPRPPRGPGPIPGPGPEPLPFAADAGVESPFLKDGALDEARVHAARDLAALRTLPAERIPEYVQARPYLIWGRWACGSPEKVGEGSLNPDGRFNICWLDFRRSLRPRCHDRYAHVVKQRFGPFWITIYDGRSAGQWHELGDDPTLTTYHGLARTCRRNPANAFVYLNHVGDTGAWDLHTPDADSAVGVAAPGLNAGLVSPNGATGFNGNRNWGRTLPINLMIGEGMKALGARYYRLSVTVANGSGDPVGTRHNVDSPVSWKKAVPDGGGGVTVVPVALGPQSVGGQDALYTIPFDSDGDWDDGQFHAFLDTQDFRWSDPDVRHLVTIEVFDETGRRLRPEGTPVTGLGGNEGTAPFTFRRRYQDLGPTAEVPFGALTHMFWWDNREVFGRIDQLIRNGLVFNAECLFLGGNAASTFAIGYRAYHPRERFQRYHNVWWKRGLGAHPGNTGWLEFRNTNNVGLAPPGPQPSGTNTFEDMLRTDLEPTRLKCAFTVFLRVYNKRTNGADVSFPHTNDSAAFVLEIES
jgi:hypothetical protein